MPLMPECAKGVGRRAAYFLALTTTAEIASRSTAAS
jgi:hypothetical protein